MLPSRLLLPSLIACAILSSPVLAQTAPPSGLSPVYQDKVLKTVSLIIGEPNYSVDSAYQELKEGFYTKPELVSNDIMIAPLQEIILNLGGQVQSDSAMQTTTYKLLGHTIEVTAGMGQATVDGRPTPIGVTPRWREGDMWVPVAWTFEQFGAFIKWDTSRQRLSASLIMPLESETAGQSTGGDYTVNKLLKQPAAFWASATGIKVADNILGYQNKDGGWPKLESNVNLTVPVNKAALEGFKAKSTIDNDSTYNQIVSLARAYQATHQPRFQDGVIRGVKYLMAAQLSNGGWQQFWPEPQGYKARVTFNDDAMTNTMAILRDVSKQRGDFSFIDPGLAQHATESFNKGLALILKTQWKINGKKTGWAAQYDERSLEPAPGRAFELASVSGGETAGVVRFLMSLDTPSPEVIDAVQSAVAWFNATKITGIKRYRREDRTLEYGFDFVMVSDPSAPPTWARFYDLQTGRPVFSARDSVPRQRFDEVSYERRVKYNWYTSEAADLLATEYPLWAKKLNLPSVLR